MPSYAMYNGSLCVDGLLELVGESAYNKAYRAGMAIERAGGRGRTSLIRWDSLPESLKIIISEKIGVAEAASMAGFASMVRIDPQAVDFYSKWVVAGAKGLPADLQVRYANSASILNAAISLEIEHQRIGKSKSAFLGQVADALPRLMDTYQHELPFSTRRLKPRFDNYKANGYQSMIHSGFGNSNARKMDDSLKSIILSIKAMPQKPYDATVLSIYNEWVAGDFDLYDKKTGEIFDRSLYIRDGKPVELSLETIRKYTKSSLDAAAVDLNLMTYHDYNNTHRPHMHRDNNLYSGSMITLDDRDLPRQDRAGNRPKCYYAFDVGSRCLIGYAHSRKKDQALFEGCIINMFRFLQLHGCGMPAEVQVENHLVKEYEEHLRAMFSFVRFCAPTNSQDKLAETRIRDKKYRIEKLDQCNIGRHHLQNKANRSNVERVNDENIERKWDYDELIADDIATINKYNNSPLDVLNGKTPLEAFLSNQNPKLQPYKPHAAAWWFGHRTAKDEPVKIYRNQYVQVARGKFAIPTIEVMDVLKDAKADCCWLANADGSVDEVHLYKNSRYVCTCKKIELYKSAQSEREHEDRVIFAEQQALTREFDKKAKDRNAKLATIAKLPIIKPEQPAIVAPYPAILPKIAIAQPAIEMDDDEDEWSAEAMARRAAMDM